jgi:AmmeMemoRadiSam system protein A
VRPEEYAPGLGRPGAAFVTLRRRGSLRGCTGSLQARHPLVRDVAENAHRTAFADPRFPGLEAAELEDLDVHLAVLSPLTPLASPSEGDLLGALRPGVDGLVLREGSASSTFLPAVWKTLPAPADFVAELKRKAGLPASHWTETLRFERYTVQEFG